MDLFEFSNSPYSRENWKLVPEFNDYVVSDYGRIYNSKTHRILYGRDNGRGYLKVVLRQDGLILDEYVHILVAELYLDGYYRGVRIRHMDGNKSNNSVMNLEILGPYRGMGPVYIPEYRGGRLVKIVETGEIFPNVMQLAIHLQADPSTIYKVLRGDRKSHLGYTFEYVD